MADNSKPLIVEDVPINAHCSGEQWTLLDFDRLAYLVAVIALGQAQHVAVVLAGLDPGSPVLGLAELKAQANKVLTVAGTDPWQRDGFIFEAISWIAAQQNFHPLRDQFLARRSDVVHFEADDGRRGGLPPPCTGAEHLEDLAFGHLEHGDAAVLDNDGGQAQKVREERHCLLEVVCADTDPRIAFYLHDTLRSL